MPRCLIHKTKFTPKYFLQKHCLETDECQTAETALINSSRKNKPTKPINKISKKLSKELVVYNGKRIIFLSENKECFAKFNGCYGDATDVHHSRGMGRYLNDTTTWLPLCRSCHNYIETHPKEAKEKGYSRSRLGAE